MDYLIINQESPETQACTCWINVCTKKTGCVGDNCGGYSCFVKFNNSHLN